MNGRYRSESSVKSKGLTTLGWLLMIPVVFVVLLILAIGFYEARKAYWDRELRQMCEKDGGGKVFATVSLNRQQYSALLNQFGQLSPPLESKAAENVPIVHRFTSSYIRRSDPEVRRDELSVIRKSDGKVLGLSVSYSRVGGDLIAFHPSYSSCPEKAVDIFGMIVRQEEEQK